MARRSPSWDDPEWFFNVFFFCLWAAPLVAWWLWHPAWLLLYIVPILIFGL